MFTKWTSVIFSWVNDELSTVFDCIFKINFSLYFSSSDMGNLTYNHFTESMHTLSDIGHDEMGLVGQHYTDDTGDYGHEGPTGPHAAYLDNGSDFYPSGPTMLSESKYTPTYVSPKSSYINNRGKCVCDFWFRGWCLTFFSTVYVSSL